jgi:hypothetical protein
VNGGQKKVQIHTGPNICRSGDEPAVTGARIVDMAGRYLAYNAQSTGKQYVDDVHPYRRTDDGTGRGTFTGRTKTATDWSYRGVFWNPRPPRPPRCLPGAARLPAVRTAKPLPGLPEGASCCGVGRSQVGLTCADGGIAQTLPTA